MKKTLRFGVLLPLLALQATCVCMAEQKTWIGSSDPNWFTATNWNPSGIPADGDSVLIDSVSSSATNVLLTNATAYLDSLVLTNRMLTFSNWKTRLYATNVTIRTNGAITLAASFSEVQMSNRIYIVCGNLAIDAGGRIDAQGKGYQGIGYQGQGPGKSQGGSGVSGPGAGYGGAGGKNWTGSLGGSTYGLSNAPTAPGSGGGDYILPGAGGNGGGAVRIEATGAVTNNGTITANGAATAVSGAGGGGSGGAIFITCASFQGTSNGLLSADGGNGGTSGGGGGGGGGRIAVGMGLSAQNIADLLAGSNKLAGMYVFANTFPYLGRISVTNGVCAGVPATTSQWGQAGSKQFMSVSAAGTCMLDIKGEPDTFGAPTPQGYGAYLGLPQDSWITNSVSTPVSVTTGLQRASIGWRLTDIVGGLLSNSASTQSIFQLTTNMVLTWRWTNAWQLTLTSSVNGSVNFADKNGWYTNASQVSGIAATPSGGYAFSQWAGDVPYADRTNNPLTVTMTQARSLAASFVSLSGEQKIWAGNGNWLNPTSTNWTPAGVPGPMDDVVIQSGTSIVDDAQSVKSLVVSNGATLVFTNWYTILTVSGDVTIRTNGVITLAPPFLEGQMSNQVYIICGNLAIDAGGKIDAQGKGFRGSGYKGQGPGKARGGGSDQSGPGAGYGGGGGNNSQALLGGLTYGLSNAPTTPGSGGGDYILPGAGGNGGGVIRIKVTGAVTNNGTITANGTATAVSWAGGGGSGGAIFITCASFQGTSNGLISADGGNSGTGVGGGGGGGGRIAVGVGLSAQNIADLLAGSNTLDGMVVYPNPATYLGRISVTNGVCAGAPATTSQWGQAGTKQFMSISAAGACLLNIKGDPDNFGAPTPQGYGTYVGLPQDSWITNSVSTPVSVTTGLQRASIGWRLTDIVGGLLSNSASTQAVFQLTTNMVLTWRWTNAWQLTLTSSVNGSVNFADKNGWYTNADQVSGILASPSGGYAFARWSGDVPYADRTNNPLTLTMTQARSLAASFVSSSGGTKTWTGTGSWIDPFGTNWTPAGLPGPLDNVVIQSGTSTVDDAQSVKSLVVSNGATLLFTNWYTILTVSGDVTIRTNGVITLAPPFMDAQMSNRVYIACGNLTIDAGGKIDARGKGYMGSGYNGQGPGKASGGANDQVNAAAGHGGKGGNSQSGKVGGSRYGVTNAPTAPGSGGSDTYVGGSFAHGGGAVRIEAAGVVTVNGTITANSALPTSIFGAGGSGGSIFIACAVLRGAASGILSADGANGAAEWRTAGGGGGRIAVWCGLSETKRQLLLANPENTSLVHGLSVTNSWMGTKFLGNVSVTNGICPTSPAVLAQQGEVGTIRFLLMPGGGTIFTLR